MRKNLFKILFVAIVFVGLVQFAVPRYVEAGLFDPKAYNDADKYKKAGDWDNAAYKCVECLTEKPSHKKAIGLLKEVAPKAYDKHIKTAKDFESKNDWDLAVAEYDEINKLVSAVLSVGKDFPTVDIGKERDNAANRAADAHYNEGISLASKEKHEEALAEFQKAQGFSKDFKDVQDQISQANEKTAEKYYNKGISLMGAGKPKEAAIEFRKSQEFMPYKDSMEKYEEARKQALRKVCIMPFENTTKFSGMEDILTRQIIEICVNQNPEFMEIMTGEGIGLGRTSDATTVGEVARSFGVHYFIKGTLGPATESSPETKLTNSYSGTTTAYYGDKSVKVPYTFREYEKERTVVVKLGYQIIDAQKGTTITSKSLSDTKVDACRWGESDVDCSILPTDYEKLCKVEKREPDSADELAERAINDLSKRLAKEILDYFK